eukprot:1340619-Amphidinium_carterae.1
MDFGELMEYTLTMLTIFHTLPHLSVLDVITMRLPHNGVSTLYKWPSMRMSGKPASSMQRAFLLPSKPLGTRRPIMKRPVMRVS